MHDGHPDSSEGLQAGGSQDSGAHPAAGPGRLRRSRCSCGRPPRPGGSSFSAPPVSAKRQHRATTPLSRLCEQSGIVLLGLRLLGLLERQNPDRDVTSLRGDMADEAPAGRQSQVLLKHEVRQEAGDQQPIADDAQRTDAICLSLYKAYGLHGPCAGLRACGASQETVAETSDNGWLQD